MGKLIRLELYNFKSYKGHHVLLFGDSYFTSIIGPNGSGKSNSMDAISFVLGIKSTYLRSTHLRDLVYRGRILKTSKVDADGNAVEQSSGADGHAEDEGSTQSSQRHDPTSAWVMAVYEDDAGEEQKWKRTVTSQGASEFRINGKVVTAKDYNEALEAENILIKARNFLVFQGDIETVANQSPKDLTRLVEQISGSLEYKSEYEKLEEEAEKATEDQISKQGQRKGINGEIRRYQEEKKDADDYNRQADERDDAVVTHVLWKLHHFQRVIEESSAEIQRFQDELKEYRRGVEQYEQQLEGARKEQTKAGRDMANHERTIKKVQKSVEEKRNEIDPINEKLKISQKNHNKYKQRIDEISKEQDSQAKAVDQLQKDLGVVGKAQTKWEQEWAKMAQKEGRQLSETDVQEYNRSKVEVNKQTANAQIKLDNLTRQRKTDEETVNSFKNKTEEYEKQLNQSTAELRDLTEKRASIRSQVKETAKDVESKKKEYNNITSERLKNSQRHTELDEKLQQVLRKLVEADDGRRQSEKEIRAKETLLAMKRLFPGVRGRVHELCKPKQKKYETAVSTVLGRHFDAVVVDSEKTARDCMAYLKEQRAGLATFLPLDTIQVKTSNSNMKGMHKNMRLAIDTVEYESVVERAISYACGDAMVCDDLSTAKYLCYEKRIEAKAVTLDGTVIHKGGLMTGGRGPQDRQRQKRWDDSEVENLRRLKDKLLTDLGTLPKPQQTVVQEETLQSELSGLQQRLALAQDESKALDKNVDSKQKELDHAQTQLNEVKPKYLEQSKAFGKLQQRIQESQNEINTVEDKIFASFCKRLKYDNIRAYEAQQGNMQQEGSQKKLEFTMQRTRLESQLKFETQRLDNTRTRVRSLEEASQRDKDLISDLETEKAGLQTELEQDERRVEQLQEQLDRLKETQTEKASKVAEVRREVQKRGKEVDSTLTSITGLEAQVQRNASSRYALLRKCKIDEVKIPLTDDSEPLASLPVDESLRDPDTMDVDEEDDLPSRDIAAVQDYGIEIDFSQLDDDLKEDSSSTQEAALLATIAQLTTILTNLNPNMRAVERLESAQDRLDSTTAAFNASRTRARDTRDAFEEIRSKRADLFNKAFNHISSQIAPIYQQLTQSSNFPLGGKAYLDTMNVDDARPFLGGIKYHAMPPLKRFRDMDALSGGEKTIAALALLFAIHSYAPSPFFVLDEVDAALDNANVAKVAKYIREHAGPGMQFIVISLKTGLFQESETLVGVLRDQGINSSRAVTLDLRKYQPS